MHFLTFVTTFVFVNITPRAVPPKASPIHTYSTVSPVLSFDVDFGSDVSVGTVGAVVGECV